MPPPTTSSFWTKHVFVRCHGDALCVCGSWCHCGLGSLKSNQHLTGEPGNESYCAHMLALCIYFTRLYAHTKTPDIPKHPRTKSDTLKNEVLSFVGIADKRITLLFLYFLEHFSLSLIITSPEVRYHRHVFVLVKMCVKSRPICRKLAGGKSKTKFINLL